MGYSGILNVFGELGEKAMCEHFFDVPGRSLGFKLHLVVASAFIFLLSMTIPRLADPLKH